MVPHLVAWSPTNGCGKPRNIVGGPLQICGQPSRTVGFQVHEWKATHKTGHPRLRYGLPYTSTLVGWRATLHHPRPSPEIWPPIAFMAQLWPATYKRMATHDERSGDGGASVTRNVWARMDAYIHVGTHVMCYAYCGHPSDTLGDHTHSSTRVRYGHPRVMQKPNPHSQRE